MEKKLISKILIGFGLVTLITSLIDFYVIGFPLQLSNPAWVNGVGQQIADRSIMPVFGIIFTVIGLFLFEVKHGQKLKNFFIKIFGVLSGLLGILLILTVLMYGLTMKKVESQSIEAIKKQSQSVQLQVDKAYEANKAKISEESYKKYIQKLNEVTVSKIGAVNMGYIKLNIKTILNLLCFSFLYLFVAWICLFPNGLNFKKNKVER